MPFPRLAEITDAITFFLSREDDDDDDNEAVHSSTDNIRNFRLVCKAFAATGARYLIPTVNVMRIPETFDIANQIAAHYQFRKYVNTLIFYSDDVSSRHGPVGHPSASDIAAASAAARIHDFQTSKQDIHNFTDLLGRFPQLKRVGIRSLYHDCYYEKRYGFATAMYKKLESDYFFTPNPDLALDVLGVLGNIETLVLGDCLYATQLPTSLPCFESMKALKIADLSRGGIWRSCWTVSNSLPVIEELDYSGSREYRRFFTDRNNLIKTLPTSLQTLRLQHIECFDQYFPVNLNILELCNVLFDMDEFPATLSQVSLSNIRLVGTDLTKWGPILLSLKAKTKLTISGCLAIYNIRKTMEVRDDPYVAYLHCGDTIITSSGTDNSVPPLYAGELLMMILQSKSTEGSYKAELLELLFSERNTRFYGLSNDIHIDTGKQFSMSVLFRTMWQVFVEDGSVSSTAPLRKTMQKCNLCDEHVCNSSYTGIVG